MAVTTDIVRTWRAPGTVMKELLSQGQREDRAVAYVMIACLIIFISYLPRIQYNVINGQGEFQRDASYAFLMWVMVMPLFLYGLAAFLHLVFKLFRGKGTHFSARLALFWSLLASTPAMLLYGLVQGLIGPGVQANVVGGIWIASFLWFVIQSFRVAENPDV